MALLSESLLVWIKRRRRQDAVKNFERSETIEMQPVDRLLSTSTTGELESNGIENIRIGIRIILLVCVCVFG